MTSHLPDSQHVAEPGMEETVHGCLPVIGSRAGQDWKGQSKAGLGPCWPEASEGPHQDVPSSPVCAAGRKKGGPAWMQEVWEDTEHLTGLGWNLLQAAVGVAGSSVQCPLS